MKKNYETLYKRNRDSGRMVIEVALNDYLEFFHEWDNAVFRRRDMHPELSLFLDECAQEIPYKEDLEIQFALPAECEEPEKEQLIKTSYHTHYRAGMNWEKVSMKRIFTASGLMLLVAFCLLFLYTILQGRRAWTPFESVLLESLLIGGWVLTWEAIHAMAIDIVEPVKRRRQIRRLKDASLTFRYM